MQKGVKAYNRLMFHLCNEYNTIGTCYTEAPERRNNWNLRDMVSEVQYTLDIYNDPDCVYYESAHREDASEEEVKQWREDVAKMRRFIRTYKNEALTMKCFEGHCSQYD